MTTPLTKKKFAFPSSKLLLFILIVVVTVATYIVPVYGKRGRYNGCGCKQLRLCTAKTGYTLSHVRSHCTRLY